ncbi:ferric reductase like transmembrane component-domain-containing protein [Lasiosphaeria miniovina]|uniref:ferric-chelate reductase (NADPH) n=1 Tax=Lasiosphaeria miniovina TaxID=1954250 RepID=A0AA40EFV3_9PEZI|nr:ferric reductase like transmembrane component-domain-containing protein [Lasiosphaeria miniovina]KAK0733683.1 ferric reductase like transmembrane component-domain-containing protein [Lasiosphaeria miniovina]
MLFAQVLWWTLGILGLIVLLIRILGLAWEKLRLISSMSQPADKQGYWKLTPWSWMPSLKRNLIYAPLWKKRHNREIRLSSALNVGTIPSRLHTVILLGYVASNLGYMVAVNWKNPNMYEVCAEIRGRSGTLSVVSMIPLMIFATRNNPLISLLSVSFDTFNLLHRWMGRIVVFEVVVHFVSWAIVQVADGGWDSVGMKILHDRFIASGTVGSAAMVVILFLALSPVRHAFYETFLNIHILLAFVAFVTTWIHCVSAGVVGGLPQTPWIIAILLLWVAERLARTIRLFHYNRSKRGYTEAFVEPMPGEACRVTMHLPRHVRIQPGQHAYLRFAGLNPWENHPFSIAWFEDKHGDSLLPVHEKDMEKIQEPTGTTVSFLISARTGFTRKLYNTAVASNSSAVTMRAAFEGPYAGHNSLDSYGHCVLFAGATGITHQISYIRHLIEGYNAGTVATRRVTLLWIIRDYEMLEWARPWMDQILRLPNRKEILRIKLFITRPKNANEVVSNSNTVRMSAGRPNIALELAKEVREQTGAMKVTVCGPGALADDVRDAVRKAQKGTQNDILFEEESFTW